MLVVLFKLATSSVDFIKSIWYSGELETICLGPLDPKLEAVGECLFILLTIENILVRSSQSLWQSVLLLRRSSAIVRSGGGMFSEAFSKAVFVGSSYDPALTLNN